MRVHAFAVVVFVAVLAVAAAAVAAEPPAGLPHRVWLLRGLPEESSLQALRSAGVTGLVVPVGRVQLTDTSARLVLAPLPDAARLAGWQVTLGLWVDGSGDARGDAASFGAQINPVLRMVSRPAGLLLATPRFFPGAAVFAADVARTTREAIELAAPATELRGAVPPGGWKGVGPVAMVFGTPSSLGLAPATLQDDLAALDELDRTTSDYRAAVVIEPRITPPPGPTPVSLAALVAGDVASFAPAARGDVFRLRRAVDWGGTRLEVGQTIEVEAVDAARLDRDLGLILRPVRNGLSGWDLAGLPARAPTVGLSLEALLDYLVGGDARPEPRIDTTWAGGSTLRISLANPTPHGTGVSTTGNWVEVVYSGTGVRDIGLGQFAGAEYGHVESGTFKRVAPTAADAVRLYATHLPPGGEVGGGAVMFVSRPREVIVRWGLRLGDGRDLVGPSRLTRP